jgi:hypothetical protein
MFGTEAKANMTTHEDTSNPPVDPTNGDSALGDEGGRRGYIWKCVDLGGQRPRGKAVKPACGRWVGTWSKKRSGSKTDRWLGQCKCGKKRSLEGAVVMTVADRDEMIDQVARMNRQEGVE